MTTRTTLALLLWLAAAATSPATELATPATVAEQSALSAYTTPLETMFGIVEQINTQLASAQDEESAEAAGEAIQELLQPLNAQAQAFSQLAAPTPEVQEALNAWFAAREHTMETMVQEVERLKNEDPAFFGSQTLIAAIVMVGGILSGE